MATYLLILYQPHWLDRPDRAQRLPVVRNSEIFPRLVLAGRNLDPLRSAPGYAKVQQRLSRIIAAQRQALD